MLLYYQAKGETTSHRYQGTNGRARPSGTENRPAGRHQGMAEEPGWRLTPGTEKMVRDDGNSKGCVPWSRETGEAGKVALA